jgi:hypothetical protein
MDVAILLYRSKCWTLTKQQDRRIETSGMRFLRATTDETKPNIKHLKKFKKSKAVPLHAMEAHGGEEV